jgi:hypothetical protein
MVLGFAPNRHDRIEDGCRPQKGVDRFEVGTCSGKSGFKCTTPSTFVCVLTASAKSGAPLCVFLDGSEVSAGRVCLALIDSCQQKMIAQNGFGQSWMSWPRCLQMRSRQRSMRETSHRREAADGTQRRSSGCASASPKVHGAKPGSDLWRVAVRLTQPVPRHSEDPVGMRQRLALPPHQHPMSSFDPRVSPLSPPIRPWAGLVQENKHTSYRLINRDAGVAPRRQVDPRFSRHAPGSHQREPRRGRTYFRTLWAPTSAA